MPKYKSLKAINTHSVIISKNKYGRNVKTQKSSPTSEIEPNFLSRQRNCVLKLRRCKMPALASGLNNFGDVSNVSIQDARNTPSATKKCRIRLSRVRQSMEQNSLLQATKVHDSPPHFLRNNQNKDNAKNCINGVTQAQVSDKLNREKQIFIGKNQNPLMGANIGFKSSTPLKPLPQFNREPFKVLNLQEMSREVDEVAQSQHTFRNQPIITKENRESLRKLSLSRSKISQRFRNKNKIVRFEPLRNSTLYAVDIPSNTPNVVETCAKSQLLDDSAMETEKHPKRGNVDISSENSMEKSQSSFKNFANRSDIIEQLLLSDDDEGQSIVAQQTQQTQTSVANKTNKFFHRTLESSKNPNRSIDKTMRPMTTRLSTKKRLTQRGKNSVGSVYEFLSQSQTSDSDTATKKLDPAADIIKKLIAEGKVRVATHKKGSGKLTIKRKNIPKKRAVVQRKKIVKKKAKEASNNNDDEPHVDYEDIQHDALEGADIPDEPIQTIEETAKIPDAKKIHETSTGGDTFSNLARSVLISETKRKENSRKKITYQRKLLEAAQKFVSTPVKKVFPPLEKTANMSPIMPQGAPHDEEGDATPWRVDDDAHLPSVFYFSRNSVNLPSFSSDYIPSSPKKQKHRYQDLLPEPDLHEPDTPPNNTEQSQLSIIPTIGAELSKSSSSFSSNDSNAENKPPSASVTNPPTHGRENLINNRQHLNPRREINCRSPLQILDIITLPPLNSSKQQYTIENNYQKSSNINTTLPNQPTKGNISDMFGFDEFLGIDTVEDEQQMSVEVTEKSNNTNFRKKLRDLKHLRPAQKEKPPSSSSNRIADIFDIGGGQSHSKQLQIKGMLCSTMINHGNGYETKSMKRNNKIYKENTEANKFANEPSELFIDPDPGMSFNENDSLRTYGRPYKRKRKLRHNFVMFLDSDESGDDDKSTASKELEIEHKKKKHKKEQKDNLEFNSFVHEFNDMCKEVDNYNMIIE